jgi:hypothetical protein
MRRHFVLTMLKDHISDAMEMAPSFSLRFVLKTQDIPLELHPERWSDFSSFIGDWLSLTVVLNSLNRCMGEFDLYPFVLPADAFSRLEFVHDLIRRPKPSAQ